jgi:putative transposase
MWESNHGFPRFKIVGLPRGILGKHCLDAGWGQFFSILEQCCFKRGIYFQKVDSRKTSQIGPNCAETGKKDLSERVHVWAYCGYQTDRDVAAAQVVLQREDAAVGQRVKCLLRVNSLEFPRCKNNPTAFN